MINKEVASLELAIEEIHDGATILSSGFGDAGNPVALLEALADSNVTNLTVVSNNAGEGDYGLAALIKSEKVSKIICSYPISAGSAIFQDFYNLGKIQLEIIPQGTLSERMRAAGAGIGAFFCPTSTGTKLGEGKEKRMINGIEYVLEYPLKGDFALIQGSKADRFGNIIYDKSARNFGPVMAMAAKKTIFQVNKIVNIGEIDPELIVTPGIFVDRIVVNNAQD